MENYTIIKKIGQGSFSEVLKATRNGSIKNQNSDYVAIKCVKQENSGSALTHHNNISLAFENREVFALKLLKPHPNIIQLLDVFVDPFTSKLSIVTELMDMNLYEFLQLYNGRGLEENVVKFLGWQAMQGLAHVHSHGFFHRDIKPENLLVNTKTMELKLADFGSCRQISSRPPYTEYISTRWYRAPECLLTMGHYSKEMDLWSIGCIIYELLTSKPLFPGKNEAQQLQCIQKVLGPPPFALMHRFTNSELSTSQLLSSTYPPVVRPHTSPTLESLLPRASPECVDFIKSMLLYSPAARLTASSALSHPWFQSILSPKIPVAATLSHSPASTRTQPPEVVFLGHDANRHSDLSPLPRVPALRSLSGEKCNRNKKQAIETNTKHDVDIEAGGCRDSIESKGAQKRANSGSDSETTTATEFGLLDSIAVQLSPDSTADSNNRINDHKETKKLQNGLCFTASNAIDTDSAQFDMNRETQLSFISQNSDVKHQNQQNLGTENKKSKNRFRLPIRFFHARKATQ